MTKYRIIRWLAFITLLVTSFSFLILRSPEVVDSTEIFPGIVYSKRKLADTAESGGAVHIALVDLSSPGLELFITTPDKNAVLNGWQYRLRWVSSIAKEENLALAVNGVLFSEQYKNLPLPGTYAKGIETIVSNYQVSHIHEHSYLLWFTDKLIPRLEYSKPPSPQALRSAKWGIGGEGIIIKQGKLGFGGGHEPDCRTVLGIDPSLKLLWVIVFENASERYTAQYLIELGVKDAIFLDGGSSSTMYIGDKARDVTSGSVFAGGVPVATAFGIRVKNL